VHSVSEVRQIEIHTAESLAPDPSHFEVEIAVARFRKYKSPSSYQIPAELIQAGGHKLINSIWNEEELPYQWKEYISLPIYCKGNKTDCSNYQFHKRFFPISFSQSYVRI
jgi:hypothetical protein